MLSISISVFVFGMIIGSFLNVVILRYGEKTLNGRSECPKCHKQLTYLELIPVFSYLAQSGKCRGCKERISYQYPLVEIATAILFVGIFLKFGLSLLSIFYAIIFSILLVIFVYDLYHKIIPDLLSFLFAFLSFVVLFYTIFPHWPAWRNILAGFIFYIPFYLIWKISKGMAMGLGDGKLSVGIGALLGLQGGISAIILGVWIAAIISLSIMGFERLIRNTQNITMKSEIPLGPFLIVGILLVFFLNLQVIDLSYFF